MDEKFLKKIKEDLEKSGFGSELKVARIFENSGLFTLVGSSYFDKDEQKTRDIDLISAFNVNLLHDVTEEFVAFTSLLVSVEIKKSEKPWVVFKRDRYDSEPLSYRSLYLLDLKKSDIVTFHKSLRSSAKKILKPLRISGIHEAFKNPNNPSKWYGASLSSIKSMLEFYEREKEEIKLNKEDDEYDSSHAEFGFFQAVIVLDGDLVSAELNKDNEIVLESIKNAEIEISLGSKNYEHSSYLVHIVTVSGLDDYLQSLKEQQINFCKIIGIAEGYNIDDCSFVIE